MKKLYIKPESQIVQMRCCQIINTSYDRTLDVKEEDKDFDWNDIN